MPPQDAAPDGDVDGHHEVHRQGDIEGRDDGGPLLPAVGGLSELGVLPKEVVDVRGGQDLVPLQCLPRVGDALRSRPAQEHHGVLDWEGGGGCLQEDV